MRISTKITFAITALAAMAALTFSACRKDRNKDTDVEDTGYASDHAMLEKSFADAQSIADEAGTDGSLTTFKMQGGNPAPLSQCAVITNDTISTPHVLTIDFGANNCLCHDGSYRRGQIIVTYLGRYRDMGHLHKITFSNYFVNDNAVSGTKSVSYTSNTPAGQPIYDISIQGQIVLDSNRGTITWNSTRTRTWLAGFNTRIWSDDEYELSGSGTMTRANGNSFTVSVTTPLHRAMSCKWIESGVLQVVPQGAYSQQVRSVDYGNGTCDNQAIVTVGNRTRTITLK